MPRRSFPVQSNVRPWPMFSLPPSAGGKAGPNPAKLLPGSTRRPALGPPAPPFVLPPRPRPALAPASAARPPLAPAGPGGPGRPLPLAHPLKPAPQALCPAGPRGAPSRAGPRRARVAGRARGAACLPHLVLHVFEGCPSQESKVEVRPRAPMGPGSELPLGAAGSKVRGPEFPGRGLALPSTGGWGLPGGCRAGHGRSGCHRAGRGGGAVAGPGAARHRAGLPRDGCYWRPVGARGPATCPQPRWMSPA
jgi:hypothetical protein